MKKFKILVITLFGTLVLIFGINVHYSQELEAQHVENRACYYDYDYNRCFETAAINCICFVEIDIPEELE